MRIFLTLLTALAFTGPTFGQLMDSKREAAFRAATPTLSDYRLFDTSDGSRWFVYTSTEMPAAHQRVSGNRTFFHVATGRESGMETPWDVTGGTEDSGVTTWKIVRIPAGKKMQAFWSTWFFDVESPLPRTVKNPFGIGGRYKYGLDLLMPKGSLIAEVMAFPGTFEPFEVRVREKVSDNRDDNWRKRRFAPFKDADDWQESTGGQVLQTIDRVYGDWQHPTNRGFDARGMKQMITSGGRELMASRTFVESRWAPSTTSTNGIVPRDYHGVAAVGNCSQCHGSAGESLRKFDSTAGSAYETGRFVRGMMTEQLLSIHPVDPTAISTDGRFREVVLNRKLVEAGLLEWAK